MSKNALATSSSVKQVGECKKCQSKMIKYGKDGRHNQRYYCKNCKSVNIENYKYLAYNEGINQNIVALTKENVGILGTSRLLKISPTTVISRIKKIASGIQQPAPLSKEI